MYDNKTPPLLASTPAQYQRPFHRQFFSPLLSFPVCVCVREGKGYIRVMNSVGFKSVNVYRRDSLVCKSVKKKMKKKGLSSWWSGRQPPTPLVLRSLPTPILSTEIYKPRGRRRFRTRSPSFLPLESRIIPRLSHVTNGVALRRYNDATRVARVVRVVRVHSGVQVGGFTCGRVG